MSPVSVRPEVGDWVAGPRAVGVDSGSTWGTLEDRRTRQAVADREPGVRGVRLGVLFMRNRDGLEHLVRALAAERAADEALDGVGVCEEQEIST